MKKLFIIAGEASGDLHASNLVKELKQINPNTEIQGYGGDEMQAAGVVIKKHYREMDFMGFIEVILNLRTIAKNLKQCKADILAFQPDAVLYIDYPGFNLRIAKWAKTIGLKNIYYISPQIWAWKEGRVHLIKKVIDKMLVILPFEKAFYGKHGMEVDFVGHPLLDAIQQQEAVLANHAQFASANELSGKPILAILPGSRKQEIGVKLPIMLQAASKYQDDFQLVVAAAPSQDLGFYDAFIKGFDVKIVKGKTYELLKNAHTAIVTSGTATLETALFQVPQVVCYKGSAVSYHIAKQLIKVKYISLVNLIMNKPVVKELIQDECNVKSIQQELDSIVAGEKRLTMLKDYEQLAEILGKGGASNQAAQAVNQVLQG